MKKFNYDNICIPKIYSKARQLLIKTLNLWLKTIQDNIELPIETILDLGCDEGRFSVPLANRFNAKVYGVDPSRKCFLLLEKETPKVEKTAKTINKRTTIKLNSLKIQTSFYNK
jgi:2-polyprenyl-3-methyl-5-hydroxy-6-metoxy-1,4-benzoquinol methylase